MVQKNYEFLIENTLPNLGFPEVLDAALKTKMQLNADEFTLKAGYPIGQEKIEYALKFQKNEDMYYLNFIEAKLTKEDGKSVKNEFRLFKQQGYNADEMLNLVKGRSVARPFISRKTGQRSEVWAKLDFSTIKEDGNPVMRTTYADKFSLVTELSKLPGFLASQDDKERLIKEMKAGDLGIVSLKINGEKQRMYLEASPHTGTINVYNAKMEKVNLTPTKMQVVQDDNKLNEGAKALMTNLVNGDQGEKKEVKKKVS